MNCIELQPPIGPCVSERMKQIKAPIKMVTPMMSILFHLGEVSPFEE